MADDLLDTLSVHLPVVSYLCAGEDGRRALYVSAAIEQLCGREAAAFIADEVSLVDLCHDADDQRVAVAITDALEQRHPYCLSYRIQHTDGSWRWVEDRGQGVYDDARGLMAAGVLIDISARVEAEARRREFEVQRERASRLDSLRSLAGGIAHEFNNVLLSVMGNIELAQITLDDQGPGHRQEVSELLDEALAAGKRASETSRGLLVYAGRGTVETQRIMLDEVFIGLRKALETSVPGHIHLHIESGPQLPIEVAREQLQHALLNLVSNAVDAIGEQSGRLSVRTGVVGLDDAAGSRVKLPGPLPRGSYVWIEIEDDGLGMDEQTAARMFDPFFSCKPDHEGLGSAAALGLMRACAGGIELDSVPGKGTRVRLLIPAVREQAELLQTKRMPASSDGRARTVLIVDDERMIRRMIRGVLESKGFGVIEGADRDQGEALIREHADAIDMAILDVNLPQGKGTELFEQLRARRPRVPVLFSSGFEQPEVSNGEDPTVSFLAKPYRSQALVDRVTTMLADSS